MSRHTPLPAAPEWLRGLPDRCLDPARRDHLRLLEAHLADYGLPRPTLAAVESERRRRGLNR